MKKYTLEQLKAFSAAAEQGSFSAAARKLGKPQSVISTQIQYLEIELGFDLFDRSRRNPVLTSRGRAILPEVNTLLQQNSWLDQITDNLLSLDDSLLSIAVEDVALGLGLEQVVMDLSQRFPALQLEFLHPGTDEIVEMVANERCHIGLMSLPKKALPDTLKVRHLKQGRLAVFVAPNHPLAKTDRVSLAELKKHRQLVIRDRQHLERHRISRDAWFNESLFSIVQLVRIGLGWSLLDEQMLESEVVSGRLVKLETDTMLEITEPVHMIWKAKSEANPAILQFVNALRI
ncbi:LysR family transcriptional regulator [Parendozoicomonas haliclonae]|uniref:HTH-type transcriptional activator CmpR n=1 Tax=Parendozoicomonas haliclonae TaxID=1960125 RepID=A0A1X7ATU1_9GAMM|nr:LysR family transcriptional regulator [Parendozoicomonas haliclonae]SMA50837.1 HTH-type transcriptional activator CmpR [Parendozoicomonas haliclonae]